MNKVLRIFVCLLVIMAILVSAGVIQDRGFFSNSNQLLDFVQPVLNAVERLHFGVGESQYYCDFAWTSSSHMDSGKDPVLVDHNYPVELVLEKYAARIVLCDAEGNEIYNKARFFIMRKFETMAGITYGQYLDYVKGVSGRLENISIPN